MILNINNSYIKKRFEVPLRIQWYSIVYFVTKRTIKLDTFTMLLAIIFRVEIRLILAIALTIILKKIYINLLYRTIVVFNERKEVYDWLTGNMRPKGISGKLRKSPSVPFSKN